MNKILLVGLFILGLSLPALAQQSSAVGPLAPCSAFGTSSGTCLQGNGTLPVTGGGTGGTLGAGKPYFRVLRITSNFTVSSATVVQFNSTLDDSGSYWDGTNFRYTPLVAGRYEFNTCLLHGNSAVVSGTTAISVLFYKSGSRFTEADYYPGFVVSNTSGSTCNHVELSLNGSTDYVDVRVSNTGSTPAIVSGSAGDQSSYFEGHWLGPQ